MERVRELKKRNLFIRLTSKIAIHDVVIFIFFFMLSKATLLSQVAPFGVAIYAILFSQKRKISMFFAFALGVGLSLWDITAVRYILSAGIITSVIGIAENKSKNTFFNAMVSFLSCLFTAVVFYQSKGSLYDLIINIFEAFLCFVTVMLTTSAFPVVFNYKKRTYIDFSETLSLISLFSIIILCLCSVPDIFGLEPSSFIALFFIMSICYVAPLSVAISAGAIFGTMLSLGKFSSASSIGAYVIIALSGGLLKGYGRLGVVLGSTLANAIITAFFSDGAQMLVNPIEILVSGMFFWGAPKKIIASIGNFFDKISIRQAIDSYEPICYDESRLERISNSLKALSDIYYMDCTKRLVGKQYILRMFDYTADKVCNGCGLKFGCWQSGNMNIYAYMTNMLKTAEQRGELSTKDLPSAFKGRCVKKDEFVKAFNCMYDIYKTDCLWLDKMGEFRKLMAGQMKGMSDTINSFSRDYTYQRDLNIENQIKSRLENIGKYPLWIYVYIKDNNFYKVCINFEENTPTPNELNKIEQIVEEVTQAPLRVCNDSQNNMLIFCQREKYSVTYAHEQRSKCDESLCGDGFMDISCENGCFVSVISDGMGSGEEAYKESRDTLRLIGEYIKAGFSTDILLSLVNSSLLLRSIKDCFSTVDLFTVDLKSGQGVLSKLGASTTYIKTQKSVYKIDCTSLPVGILKNVEAQSTKFSVDKWAMVIMVSDGIANTIYAGEKENDWIYNEIQALNTHNPHVVAKKIMEKSIKESGGRAEDDMTITVINIMKNE